MYAVAPRMQAGSSTGKGYFRHDRRRELAPTLPRAIGATDKIRISADTSMTSRRVEDATRRGRRQRRPEAQEAGSEPTEVG